MIKFLRLTFCFALFIASDLKSLAFVQDPVIEELSNSKRNSMATLIESNNRFALELYRQLKGRRGNLFFSPYSISTLFAALASGAKENTLLEMQKVLHFSPTLAPFVGEMSQVLKGSEGKNAVQLIMANAIWLQEGASLLPTYQSPLSKNYPVNVERVNFEAGPIEVVGVINQWVAKQTKGKINQILMASDISAQTRLVLTSAAYLRGPWAYLFDLKQTKKAPFYVSKAHSLQVEMMNRTGLYPLLVQDHFSMVQMPYFVASPKGPHLAMFVLLPEASDGLETIERMLTLENWSGWVNKMQMRSVALSLPKFRVDNRVDLNQALIELGMIEAFSPKANFSGMTNHKDIFLGKAIHKTFIRVDERGTETAAVMREPTNAISVKEGEEPYSFTVNRAFIFLIADTATNSILFIGRIIRP